MPRAPPRRRSPSPSRSTGIDLQSRGRGREGEGRRQAIRAHGIDGRSPSTRSPRPWDSLRSTSPIDPTLVDTKVKGVDQQPPGVGLRVEGLRLPVRGLRLPVRGLRLPIRGLRPPVGGLRTPVVLLVGAPGTGKTLLAKADRAAPRAAHTKTVAAA